MNLMLRGSSVLDLDARRQRKGNLPMRFSFGVLPIVSVLSLAISGLSVAQEKSEKQGPQLAQPANAMSPRAEKLPTPAPAAFRGVHLQIDGNLAGRVMIAGSTRPAHAQVSFVRGGRLVGTVGSDEFGRFQITGLTPGVYSVGARGPAGITIFAVPILPFEPNSPGAESILNVKLISQSDYGLLPTPSKPAIPTMVIRPEKSAAASPAAPLGAASAP
jgi:hypothetical protein